MSKRKSDNYSETSEPPSKRFRPASLPDLPPISPELEKYVFTHASAASKADRVPVHYDRLEFLGDAHLQLIATTLIYEKYSTANAGRMAQIRQQLVQNETLCQYSQMYGFDQKLKMTRSDKPDKRPLTKIYGDVFEAYIGAIFQSDPINGPIQAKVWLEALWAPRWEELLAKFPPELVGQKEELAKKIRTRDVRLDYLDYGKPIIHKGKGIETYTIGVYLTGFGYSNRFLGSGKAHSKIQAGQAAAMAVLANEQLMKELTAKKAKYMAEQNATGEASDQTPT